MITVNYRHTIVTSNDVIEPDGFSSIEFENIGNDNAYINQSIPLTANSLKRKFENDPDEIIKEKFSVNFAGNATDKKVLVIKTYYNRVEIISNINPQFFVSDKVVIFDDSNPGITYFGYVSQGGIKKTSEKKFAIKKVSKQNNTTLIEWAEGNARADKVWNLKEKYSYTFLKQY